MPASNFYGQLLAGSRRLPSRPLRRIYHRRCQRQLWIFLLDVATYADNVGTTGTPVQSRDYMVRLSADF